MWRSRRSQHLSLTAFWLVYSEMSVIRRLLVKGFVDLGSPGAAAVGDTERPDGRRGGVRRGLAGCYRGNRVFFGSVGLPEEKLVQERVDRLGAFHHHHVTALLDHFQKPKQEDLEIQMSSQCSCIVILKGSQYEKLY